MVKERKISIIPSATARTRLHREDHGVARARLAEQARALVARNRERRDRGQRPAAARVARGARRDDRGARARGAELRRAVEARLALLDREPRDADERRRAHAVVLGERRVGEDRDEVVRVVRVARRLDARARLLLNPVDLDDVCLLGLLVLVVRDLELVPLSEV